MPEHIIEIPLDRDLPLIPVFVIPYLLWFAYIAAGLIYVGHRSKENYYKLVMFLGAGMSLAYMLYMLFPNAVSIRPAITGNDPFSWALKIVYKFDTPTNVCPSVHVINSVAVTAAIIHTWEGRKRAVVKAAAISFCAIICMSTVFIKQHSVVDVVCGLIVGAVFYVSLYKMNFPRSAPGFRGAE
ncbi:MAG: phosphatase PAP2 family protein [Clostridiales bacterium]|nr:phosphatase PAP2 family protein [Clostridiales bacterium]